MNASVRGTANAVFGALNEVMGRFESDKMASIFELNNKPFILHILNLRAD
jgi:hypothetical protein